MLLGPSATAPHDERGLYTRVFGGGLFAMAAIGLIYMVVRGAKAVPFEPYGVLGPTAEDFGGIDAFGRVLFSDGLAPFELSSALLMVAVIGAVAVARGNQPNKFTVRTGEEGSGTTAGAARHEELPQ
jgi:NADH-quinone oxidoreductase subunit J